ncbi:hypothetical protein LSI54_07275 [Nesterenkonia sp. AY15]|uniref:hypothetical protein n=1 Tax=Nesterenkonia sp. AY15 TaxID=2901139 RepID=UPI001F4D0B0F|nr:hypothetical protein [Nesterenkonia sp. AY15]MCH8571156.1 hypothetical protein [Nesterenkonia sp. AY15]
MDGLRLRLTEEDVLLVLDDEPYAATKGALEELGWEQQVCPDGWDNFGSVQVLEVDCETGKGTGAEDDRRAGSHAVIDYAILGAKTRGKARAL